MKWLYPVSLVALSGYLTHLDARADAAGTLIVSLIVAWMLV
jgi:hypothetical protein